jgi:hypothetical protein
LRTTVNRLFWFVGLWLAGVTAVGALAYFVRFMIPN